MASDYTVVAQQQSSDIDPSGQLVDVWRITFSTVPEGITGTVTVAASDYSASAVGSLIDAQVAKIKSVQAL